jgi:L-amino acid N-acyltransferase YncA
MAEDRYPREVTLKDGSTVALRLMKKKDEAAIRKFAARLSPDDLLFLRIDITSQEGLDEWFANVKAGRNVTVLAYAGKALAGYASLSRNAASWTRRVGEIRVNVAPDKRGTGLGGRLTAEAFDVARAAGLRKLTAQMTPDQKAARSVFEHLGFRVEALLTDWVEDRQGRPRDLIVMAYDLDGLSDQVDEPIRA